MEVILITGVTPAKENIRGVSAHPYFLLIHRPKDVHVKVISYNMNAMSKEHIKNMEKELDIEIVVVPIPLKYRILQNRFVQLFLSQLSTSYMEPSRQVYWEITRSHPDVIWTYPNFFYKWAKLFPQYKFVHSAPDSGVLGVVREFRDAISRRNLFKRIYRQFVIGKAMNNDKEGITTNSRIHFVGMDDLRAYENNVGGHNGFFLLHPHYVLQDKIIDYKDGKLRVVIPGKYDIYMRTGIDDMVSIFIKQTYLQDRINITFLGKGWNFIVDILQRYGYVCKIVEWVDDYIAELVNYDIQLSPITYGTGTKGKVLDALGNGLLCIGTPYAFENICVRHQESCLCYHHANELPSIFLSIYNHRTKYEKMAIKGREQVRKYHMPARISKRFFDLMKK